MLYLHETHAVIGEHETAFEHHVREGYLQAVASDPDTRLVWYLDSTHGAGEGYKVVTVTAFADPAAYDRLLVRLLDGDLAAWMRRADELRYSVEGMLLVDGPGHHLASLADVPVDGREHEPTLLRQDRVRAAEGVDLVAEFGARTPTTVAEHPLVRFECGFLPALGGVEPGQIVLLHRIVDVPGWIGAWRDDVMEWPGGLGAVPGETGRETRLLRTSRWSPLG